MVSAQEIKQRQQAAFKQRQASRSFDPTPESLERNPKGFKGGSSKRKRRASKRKFQFNDPVTGRLIRGKLEKGADFEQRREQVVINVARRSILAKEARGETVDPALRAKFFPEETQNQVIALKGGISRKTETLEPTKTPVKDSSKQSLRTQIIGSLLTRQFKGKGFTEFEEGEGGIIKARGGGKVGIIESRSGQSLIAKEGAKLDITQSPTTITKALAKRRRAKKEAVKKEVGFNIITSGGRASDILINKATVAPIPTISRAKSDQELSAGIAKLPFKDRLIRSIKTGESTKAFDAREGLPSFKQIFSGKIKDKPFTERLGIVSAKVVTGTGKGFGTVAETFKKHPVKTTALAGAFAVGGVAAGAGLTALGVSSTAASATVTGVAVGGFATVKEIRRPGSVTSPEGFLSTTTEFGTFALGAKGLIKGGRAGLKAGTKTTINIKATTPRPPKISLSKTVSSPKQVAPSKVSITSKGGKITQKIQEGRFLTPRTKQTVRTFDFKKPISPRGQKTFTFTKGTVVKNTFGFKRVLKFEGVQQGKSFSGLLRGRKTDITLTRTAGGKLKVTKFRRGSGRIINKKEIDFDPQRFSLDKTFLTKQSIKVELKGRTATVNGQTIRPSRANIFRTIFKGGGTGKEQTTFRTTRTNFRGRVKERVFQKDVSLPQKEIIQAGKFKSITLKKADIRFSENPTFKPQTKSITSEKLFISDKSPVKVVKTTHRPELFTTRKFSGDSSTRIIQETSRAQPIRGFKKILSGPFKGKLAQHKLIQSSKFTTIETKAPSSFSTKSLTFKFIGSSNIQSALLSTGVAPIAIPITSPISRSKSITRTRTNNIVTPLPRTRTRINTRTSIIPDTITDTRIVTTPVSSTITDTRTRTITQTETNTPSFTGPGDGGSGFFVPGPPPPPPPPFIPIPGGFGAFGAVKTRRKKKGRGRTFNPGLTASRFKIFGKTPKVLTGIGIRPIPISRKGGFRF